MFFPHLLNNRATPGTVLRVEGTEMIKTIPLPFKDLYGLVKEAVFLQSDFHSSSGQEQTFEVLWNFC